MYKHKHNMNKKIFFGGIAFFICTSALLYNTAIAFSQELTSEGEVSYVPSDSPTPPLNPIDPEIPTQPVTPPEGSAGELAIDFASSLDFGMNKISNQDKTYYAQAQHYADSSLVTPNFVQITDNRGNLAGWTLKIKELSQFQADEASKYTVLQGAALSFLKPISLSNGDSKSPTSYPITRLVPGVETIVSQAQKGAGGGSWLTRWGGESDLIEKTFSINKSKTKKSFTSAVTLYVPGDSPKEAANYRTNLLWILSELPVN